MAVYQEQNKKKWTKDGRSWCFRVYYTNMYGERKQKVSKMYRTRTLAREAENTFLNEIKCNDITDKNISFVEVYNEWLDYKGQLVKPTTSYGIEKSCNKYILKYFEKYKLHSIKIKNINDWKNKLNNEKIKLNSKNKQIGYFKEFLNYAIDNYDFDKKVAARLQKFRDDSPKKEQSDAEINFWTYEEYSKFIESVDDDFYKTLFEFMYYTGVRLGELRALTWSKVNFEKKTLKINENLTTKVSTKHKLKNSRHTILTPKTQNSIRIIDLDDKLIELLKKHYTHEKNLYNFNNDMFIFGNVKYIPETTLRRNLYKYTEIAKVKKITPHGFRHSHVSLLIHLGCDVYEVAERVGDTVEMILKTYYHMFPDKRKHTINVINKLKS